MNKDYMIKRLNNTQQINNDNSVIQRNKMNNTKSAKQIQEVSKNNDNQLKSNLINKNKENQFQRSFERNYKSTPLFFEDNNNESNKLKENN